MIFFKQKYIARLKMQKEIKMSYSFRYQLLHVSQTKLFFTIVGTWHLMVYFVSEKISLYEAIF